MFAGTGSTTRTKPSVKLALGGTSMKVRLPLMVLDQFETAQTGQDPIERFEWNSDTYVDEVFLDGPITSRVAILDFDEKTGALRKPVKLGGTDKVARYNVPDGGGKTKANNPNDRGFQAVSVLGGVLHALHLFESNDVLGRAVEWAFDSKQLLVIPRAGHWRNAYYERATSSLQFFSFPGDDIVPTVHTSLSLDIVSHEAGHAILDAIAPHLYDCVTPQSLALHEAVGDLTALFATLNRDRLRRRLLEAGDYSIEGSNAYTRIATAFGHYGTGDESLRTMWNTKKLNQVKNPNDTHGLSEVLSGAIYEMLVWAYKDWWKKLSPTLDTKQANKALDIAAGMIRRVAFRGLDYLPPGEVSFADYARASIAADTVSNPNDPECRVALINICKARKIGNKKDMAYVDPKLDHMQATTDIDELSRSDWHAYHYVEEHREAFHVPPNIGFMIEPRLIVDKVARRDEANVTYHEMIMKISWEELEQKGRPRWVRFGTTVAFDRQTGLIRAVVTTNPKVTKDRQIDNRTRFVDELIENGFLDDEDSGSTDHDSGLRFRGTGRTLHASRLSDGPAVDVASELRRMNRIVEGSK